MKQCSRCKKEKPNDSFHSRSGKNKSGLYSWCKDCHAEHQKLTRDSDKKSSNKRIQELREERRNELRKIAIDFLIQNPCKKCGEKDPVVLEFDHRDPKEKEFCISNGLRSVPSVERFKLEISKCDVLCANCHRRKTAKENKNFKLTMAP